MIKTLSLSCGRMISAINLFIGSFINREAGGLSAPPSMGVADLWLKVINARFLDRGGEAEGRLPALHKQPAFEWRVVMRFSAVTVTQPHAWGFQYRAALFIGLNLERTR